MWTPGIVAFRSDETTVRDFYLANSPNKHFSEIKQKRSRFSVVPQCHRAPCGRPSPGLPMTRQLKTNNRQRFLLTRQVVVFLAAAG